MTLTCWRVSLAAVALAALTAPRPARACSILRGLQLGSVWPEDGSQDVPANVRFVVTYYGQPLFAEDSIAMRALEIRPAGGGAAVPVLVTDVAAVARPLRFLLSVQPAADLEAGKDYELLGRIVKNSCGGGCPIEPTPVPIARFRTAPADHEAPTFAGATGLMTGVEWCDSDACCGARDGYVVYFTKDAASEPALYAVYAAGSTAMIALGEVELFYSCSGNSIHGMPLAPGEYVVRAVDRAGNEDTNQRRVKVELRCPARQTNQGFLDGGAGPGGGGGGCAVSPGGRTRAVGFTGILLVLAVLGLVWVRGRVYVARR